MSKAKPAVLAAFLVTLLLSQSVGAAETSVQVLKGRIIRALAVHPEDPNRILVGNKGKKAGSALLFESRDGGETWKTINGRAALSPKASDVQAVLYGPDGTVLAGTWKHGLFLSRDDGQSFTRHKSFPSKDVRDLKSPRGKQNLLFAATGRDGLFKSEDGGATWVSLGLKGTFFWSLSVSDDGQQLFAASPGKAVHRSRDGGKTWDKVFDAQPAYHAKASPRNDKLVALAAEKGLYLSVDGGDTWQADKNSLGTKFSSVLWLRSGEDPPWAGAWANGLHHFVSNVARENRPEVHSHRLSGLPVLHLRQSGDKLLVGTWGKGLHILDIKETQAP